MTALATSDAPVRRRIRVVGVVQGVGFRPFVHRLATELGLTGHVSNDTEGVLLEVEGHLEGVTRFAERLVGDAPPLAKIYGVETTTVDARWEEGFRIVESQGDGAVATFISPDVSVCDDCVRELFDPKDRRHRYPFINCTNCGPRFTITKRLPYDRPNTTMGGFALCGPCEAEYHDPVNRRFHAQPLACEDCGPHIEFDGAEQAKGTNAALAATHLALDSDQVIAVKGLGGYHLVCSASSASAVATLRHRKHRPEKPFAVMAADLSVAQTLAVIGPEEAALLLSPQRPIVLLTARPDSPISELVAPANPYIGVMLPYTPLHLLLFAPVEGSHAPVPTALVMTSGNLTDEPICYDDGDARQRLQKIVDGWLVHDRPIHVPCDDSVVRIEAGEEMAIRRSRGYAPLPMRFPFSAPPVLAMGGELKNTFCLASGHNAWMSQHIGDMGSVETLAAFAHATKQFEEIYDVHPETVAADLHPGYQTRRWAEDSGKTVELVQHHHAHLAAIMVEHGVPAGDRVIGFAFDGTGYGTDGAIWGGEVLVCGYDDFERFAHLGYVPLPGGDATIRKPYRAALAHLWAADIEWSGDLPPVQAASPEELTVIARQLERGIQSVPTSSMGRLFDAVSSLLGVRQLVSYEAQAAIELETVAATRLDSARSYSFGGDGSEIDSTPVLAGIVADLASGWDLGDIAAGFHLAVADLITRQAHTIRQRTGLERVALSGGVFQNVLVTTLARERLLSEGFEVLSHRVVPSNDGGLALGQAAVAGYRATLRKLA